MAEGTAAAKGGNQTTLWILAGVALLGAGASAWLAYKNNEMSNDIKSIIAKNPALIWPEGLKDKYVK